MAINIDAIYLELHSKYKEQYPHNPDGVLRNHLYRTRMDLGAGIIYLAVKNGVSVPDVERLMKEGATIEEASETLGRGAEVDPQLYSIAGAQLQKPSGFQRISIAECDEHPAGWRIALYGRVMAIFVGGALPERKGSEERAQIVLSDGSGMVLVQLDRPLEVTVMRGSVLKTNGIIEVHEETRYISATNIVRLQTVEDGFDELSRIQVAGSGELPELEGSRLVRPPGGKTAETVTVGRERRTDLVMYGCILCVLSIIPVIGILTCVAGFILLLMGLTTEVPKIREYETARTLARLLLEHHPPWLRSRCISIGIHGRRVHLCARCTGTVIGVISNIVLRSGVCDPLLITALATPATLDWATQKLGYRESSNPIRLLTGYLLGLAVGLSCNTAPSSRIIITFVFAAATVLITAGSTRWIIPRGDTEQLGMLQPK
jgi:uncharacterized membrane protein